MPILQYVISKLEVTNMLVMSVILVAEREKKLLPKSDHGCKARKLKIKMDGIHEMEGIKSTL